MAGDSDRPNRDTQQRAVGTGAHPPRCDHKDHAGDVADREHLGRRCPVVCRRVDHQHRDGPPGSGVRGEQGDGVPVAGRNPASDKRGAGRMRERRAPAQPHDVVRAVDQQGAQDAGAQDGDRVAHRHQVQPAVQPAGTSPTWTRGTTAGHASWPCSASHSRSAQTSERSKSVPVPASWISPARTARPRRATALSSTRSPVTAPRSNAASPWSPVARRAGAGRAGCLPALHALRAGPPAAAGPPRAGSAGTSPSRASGSAGEPVTGCGGSRASAQFLRKAIASSALGSAVNRVDSRSAMRCAQYPARAVSAALAVSSGTVRVTAL